MNDEQIKQDLLGGKEQPPHLTRNFTAQRIEGLASAQSTNKDTSSTASAGQRGAPHVNPARRSLYQRPAGGLTKPGIQKDKAAVTR